MDGGHVIPDAIRELLEKRGTFQGWLGRLDELGDEFRPEVAEKVRSDYAGRLAEVETELEGHRTELEEALADRSSAVDRVAAEHDARSAELEETQLRHAVGEFDDAEWERRRAEHQVQIDELEGELNSQRAAVESLQSVLGELTGAAVAVAAVEPTEETADQPEDAVETWPETEGDAEAVMAADDAGQDVEVVEAAPWMTQPFADAEAEGSVEEAAEPEDEADVVGEDFEEVETLEAADTEAEAEVFDLGDDGPDDEQTSAGEEGPEATAEVPDESGAELVADEGGSEDFMDELEFLESLSLDDADSFDAVSAMLDEEDGESGSDGAGRKETEGP
jgi:hypothetical protein